MSNLLTDNIYFDCQTYNNTTTNIKAQSNDDLSFDILSKTQDYNLCITKAQIPLDSIPLTKSNIPLKTYEITLSQGGFTASAYVRQQNASQDNFLYTLNPTSNLLESYKYTSSGATSQGTSNLPNTIKSITNLAYDDYLNVYVVGNLDGSNVPNTLFVLDSDNNIILTQEYTFIKNIYIDNGQNVYICDDHPSGSVVSIYSNQNGLNSVVLTLITTLTADFAGVLLHNLNSVVADSSYLIVGHDSNIVTFYNPQNYQPISDITLSQITGLIKSMNILQESGNFILSDVLTSPDNIFGLSSSNIYNIYDNNNQITNSGSVHSKLVLIGIYAFVVQAGNTYYFDYSTATFPVNPTILNNTTLVSRICSDRDTMYGLSTGDYNLIAWNQSGTINNSWYNICDTLSVDGTSSGIKFFDFDFNESNDKLLAVSTTNDLYISNNPVKPAELYAVSTDNKTVTRYGYNTNNNPVNLSVIETIQLNDIIQIKKYGTFYYTQQGSNIYKYNTSSFSVPILGITPPNTIDFDILQGGTSVIVAGINNIYCYDSTTGNLTSTFNIPAGDITCLCTFLCGPYVAVGTNQGNVWIIDYTTPATPTSPLNTNLITGSIIDLCVNGGDLVNSIDSLFTIVEPAGSYEVIKTTFGALFASVQANQIVYTTPQTLTNITCNSTLGHVIFSDILNISIVLYQQSSYANVLLSPFNSLNIYAPNDINNTVFFTQITSNIQIKSISVSKTNPHTLYAVGESDNLIYSGTYTSGQPVTFARVVPITQTYDLISNYPNTDDTGDSTLRLYSLSNQSQVQSLVLSGNTIRQIAKNVENEEFLIPLKNTNQVASYNPSDLSLKYVLSSIQSPYYIYAKNGDDITAGNVDIYYMQVLINAINEALLRASTKLKDLGSTITPSLQSISLNYSTQLLTINYDPKFAVSPAYIQFSQKLLTICNFSNINGQIVLNPTGTINQNQKSIYRFNNLTGGKIKFATTTLFVNGNYYGSTNPNQSNSTSSNRIITDLDIPTDTFIDNIGQILYYQPNGTLRPYTMYSNLPLRKITLQVEYEYRDLSEQYSLYLLPDQNFTVKLNFIKKY